MEGIGLLYLMISFGIWPALPLTGHLVFNSWIRESSITPLPKFAFFSLMTVAGITVWSIPMLMSAAMGIYRADYFGLAGWIITLFTLLQIVKKKESFSRISIHLSKWDLALFIGLSLAGYLYLAFPCEGIWFHHDYAFYANHGIFIAHHGRLDIPYPWPKDFDDLFLEGFNSISGLFPTQPAITAPFSHLFPVWMAQAFYAFDYHGLFRINAIFAILSLGIFYGLCRSVVPKSYGILAVLFFAFNPSQLWMARITLTEIFTQLFICSGLLLLLLAQKSEDRKLALWAGLFFGFSAMIRIDSFFLLPLIFLSPVVQNLADPASTKRLLPVWISFFKGALPVFAFSLANYALLSTPYFQTLSPRLSKIGFASLISLSLFLISTHKIWGKITQKLFRRRFLLTWVGICLILLTIYAYWVRPHIEPYSLYNNPASEVHGTRNYREDTLVNLSKYLSPLVVFIGILGWYIALWRAFQKEKDYYLLPFMICFAGVSALYLFNPLAAPYHFFEIRRFVPVVIPGFIFFAVLGMQYLLGKVPKKHSMVKFSIPAMVVIFLIIFTIKADKLIFTFSEYRGSYLQFKKLAEKLSGDSLILSNGSHWWITPLHMAFDRNVVHLNLINRPGIFALYSWVALQTGEQKPVYMLSDEPIHFPGLNFEKMDEVILKRVHTEHTHSPLPQKIVSDQEKIVLYKITGIDQSLHPTLTDVNRLILAIRERLIDQDLINQRVIATGLDGCYVQEFLHGIPVRWTNGNARLEVGLSQNRLPKAISVDIASTGGVKEKKIRLFVNGYELFNGQITDGGFSQIFSLAGVPLEGEERLTIELMSDIHVPSQVIKDSSDNRALGVLLKGIRLLDGIFDPINVSLGSERVIGVEESGYHGQEYLDNIPVRWTNGAAKLVVPLDETRLPKFVGADIGPTGMGAEKRVKILANGHRLFEGKLPKEGFTQILSLSRVPLGKQLTLELLSNTHIPKEVIKESTDVRTLGVLVKSIQLLDKNYLNLTLGGKRVFGVDESGFHGQEFHDGKPFRWTNGAAKLIIDFYDKKQPEALSVNIGSTGIEGEKRLRVLVNGHRLFNDRIPAGGWSRTFSLSGVPLGNQAIIELLSDTHVPKETVKGSQDTRTLGVSVKGILLLKSNQP